MEVGAAKIDTAEISYAEVGIDEGGAAEVGVMAVGIRAEAVTAEGDTEEVATAEGGNLLITPSPFIPLADPVTPAPEQPDGLIAVHVVASSLMRFSHQADNHGSIQR